MTDTTWMLAATGAAAAGAVAVWLRHRRQDARDRAASTGVPDDQFLERMRHIVRGRPARERLVLMLTEVEGLSIEDTAEVLGISVEQVTALQHLVHGALYAAVDGDEGEQSP